MTISYGVVGSVLTEQPPSGHAPASVRPDHSLARTRATPLVPPLAHAPTTGGRQTLPGIGEYEVVYDDPNGLPMLAFSDGHWFDVTSVSPRPVSVRHALRRDPAWAGAVVQTSCLWMRSHPNHERSFDLATELALAVGELARQNG